jgi:hypothetical protein
MAKPIIIWQNDTGSPILIDLTADGRPFPLNPTWPIFFAMRPASGLAGTTFKKAAEYVADGRARYVPEASDVAVPGNYVAVCEVVTPSGPITFPEDGWDVLIRPDVG